MLIELSQAHEGKYHLVLLICEVYKGWTHKNRAKTMVTC
jgi:hypothetical protein